MLIGVIMDKKNNPLTKEFIDSYFRKVLILSFVVLLVDLYLFSEEITAFITVTIIPLIFSLVISFILKNIMLSDIKKPSSFFTKEHIIITTGIIIIPFFILLVLLLSGQKVALKDILTMLFSILPFLLLLLSLSIAIALGYLYIEQKHPVIATTLLIITLIAYALFLIILYIFLGGVLAFSGGEL